MAAGLSRRDLKRATERLNFFECLFSGVKSVSVKAVRRFSVLRRCTCLGSGGRSVRVSALLCWRRQQGDPLEGVADRQTKDSTPAGQQCVARADLARHRCRRGPRRRPPGPPVQRRSPQLDGEAGRNTGMLPPDIAVGERRRLRHTFRPNVSRQDRCATV